MCVLCVAAQATDLWPVSFMQVFWSLTIIGWVYTVLAAQRVAQRQVASLPVAEDLLWTPSVGLTDRHGPHPGRQEQGVNLGGQPAVPAPG